jgi:putative DNA primase/helicase
VHRRGLAILKDKNSGSIPISTGIAASTPPGRQFSNLILNLGNAIEPQRPDSRAPQGVLAFRDELISLLKTLDREEFCAARGFYLSAWNGTSGYTFDRIIRGKTRIEAACLSLVGSTQPGRLAEYIRRANAGSAGDDGLLQRFGLLVWPDQSGDWKEIDRYPDGEAKRAAWDAFIRLDGLDATAIGAEHDEYSTLPFLRFDSDGQGIFAEWRADLERRLRGAEMPPALESHLAKYRKLVPALALVNHLADGGTGAVSEAATLRALAFAVCLESHARRAYSSGLNAETTAARRSLNTFVKETFETALRCAMRCARIGLI